MKILIFVQYQKFKKKIGNSFYKKSYGEIIYYNEDYAYINPLFSPVIEYYRGSINKEEKALYSFRLWIETKYFDDKGNVIEKNADIVKDYNKVFRYFKKQLDYIETGRHEKTKSVYKNYVSQELKDLLEISYKIKY